MRLQLSGRVLDSDVQLPQRCRQAVPDVKDTPVWMKFDRDPLLHEYAAEKDVIKGVTPVRCREEIVQSTRLETAAKGVTVPTYCIPWKRVTAWVSVLCRAGTQY